MEKNYELVIIGAGPGGYVAAIRSAQLGAKVLVVEKDELGGTCLNRGCIPTKALVASANVLLSAKKAGQFGVKAENVSADITAIIERKNKIVKNSRLGIAGIFKSYNIESLKGNAVFTASKELDVAGEKISFNKCIIATGSMPSTIPGITVDGNKILTSDHILDIQSVPSSLLIIGSGAIGIEFACIFNALGSKVTIVEVLPRILPNEDEEISEKFKQLLVRDGIEIKTDYKVATEELAKYEKILVATGRKPVTENLGLEPAGIQMNEKGFIAVNDKMETNVQGIYAIGDVAGGPLLAHKASQEGIIAAENACGQDSRIDYNVIPGCVYSIPEVASVGLSEKKAIEKGYEVGVGRFPFAANGRAITLGETKGFAKVVIDLRTDVILGVHVIGAEASELIAEAVLAVKMKATTKDLTKIMHAHPTMSEAVFEAAHDAHKQAIDLPKRK
ncbi:MAG: dihydrolipoyl dehydrogenase [Elusimicrobia bacterium]|nr:dihydrolipoyl dehydrogenase [Elusimicrobiota bacterium]MBU2615218.1 dihydrolipoyl dehydrogenase [Elusimicrobiota bacterium]